MFYQVVTGPLTDDKEYLEWRFGTFLKQHVPYRSVSREEFDQHFEMNMQRDSAVEISENPPDARPQQS
jgi:hypothetical protein